MKKEKKTRPARSKKPLIRNPQKSRENILKQAADCFARSGFKGTSLSDILARVKINKRMIYHYFGSKEGLYRAVHIAQWQALESWFAVRLIQSSRGGAFKLESRELLLEALSIFHEFVSSNQLFLRLLMWDGLEGGKVSRSIWKEIREPIYQRMEMLVVNAQENGVLAKDLIPGHLVISFLGAISFYFGYAHSLEDIIKKPALSPTSIQERKDQILKLFDKAMPPSHPPKI
jgi:TetR/AcrR family transcriptional regulator